MNTFLVQQRLADNGWNDEQYASKCKLPTDTHPLPQSHISKILSGDIRRPSNLTLQRMAFPLGLKASNLMLPLESTPKEAA